MSRSFGLSADDSRHRGLGEGSARDQFWTLHGDGAVRLLEQSRVLREPVGTPARGWLRQKPKPTGEQAWFLPVPGNNDVGLIITAARSIAPGIRSRGFLVPDDVNAADPVRFDSLKADGSIVITRNGKQERLSDVVATGVTLRRSQA